MNFRRAIKVLQSVRDGITFLATLMLFATAVGSVILLLQSIRLNTNVMPVWAILIISIASLIAVLLTYKDISEVATNSERKEVSKRYHAIFSTLTVVGYAGTLYIQKEPLIGIATVLITFVGKYILKQSALKKHT